MGTSPFFDDHPLAAVKHGMCVIDSRRKLVGRVAYVRMSDPDAVTSHGLDRTEALRTGPGPDRPEDPAARMLRLGYLKIDGPTPTERDRYAAADQIAGIEDDTVLLAIPAEATVLTVPGAAQS